MDISPLIDWAHQCLAQHPRTPCLLVVDADVARLRALANAAVAALGWPVVDIGAEVSAALLDVPAPQRERQVRGVVTALIMANAPGPLLCTEIDILFVPELRVEPLGLLRQASQRVPLLVFWPGSYANEVLTYAAPGHRHQRRWVQPDLCSGCILPFP